MKKRGRTKGSPNQDNTQVELKRIKEMVKKQLKMLQNWVTVRHLALDGYFALQKVRQYGLYLISKLRYDAALYFRV